VYDSGYLGPNALMAREAMRCAEKGMSMDEIMARVRHVEERLFSFFIISSASKKNLASWGRIIKDPSTKPPTKLTADDVGAYEKEHGLTEPFYTLGNRPNEGQGFKAFRPGRWGIGGSRDHPAVPRSAGMKETQALKAMNTFSELAHQDGAPDTVKQLLATEIAEIQKVLKPGQKIMDLCIGTPIRHDISIQIGQQMKEALPVEGEITIVDSMAVPMLCQYGEFICLYWIEG
jgi:hypothetical protein